MAITPAEAMALTEEEKREVSVAEAAVDAILRNKYCGISLTITSAEVSSLEAIIGSKRMRTVFVQHYSDKGWIVNSGDKRSKGRISYYFTFAPLQGRGF